ncbi:MAG: hypothetical protein HYZ54_00220 [Ignavibacteriae bacterium]|nr:hypothetical protein [Ignavibacteriota bacterium]
MLYGKLIHDYLDGSLDSNEEDLLFAEMSANQEVRREFQLQAKLNSTIKKDMSLATTPVEATQAVFASLGFALPSNSENNIAPTPVPSAGKGFWIQFYPHIITALLSGFFTAILIMLLISRDSDSKILLENMEKLSQEISASPLLPKPPLVNSFPVSNSIASFQNMNNVASLLLQPDDLLGITVEGYGISKISSFPNLSDNSVSLPFLSNLSTSVLYAISEHHAVGLAGGREVFHEDFTRDSYGQSFSYSQSPSLWWYGFAYRYSFSDIGIRGLNPFIQGFAGWAQNGPLGKLTVGIRYTPEQRISFILGAEGSYLVYPVGGKYFTTQKVAFTYGMSVNL